MDFGTTSQVRLRVSMPVKSSQLRALLLLGRVSNLPTVWSNCLAAWLLNDGGRSPKLFLLGAGATSLYTGGMFLNDAFDVEFDRLHRAERPIPAGQISARSVWVLGSALLLFGQLLLFPFGLPATLAALLLVTAILLYDALHKRMALAPLIMAACRFLLYVVAAIATGKPLGFLVTWHGLALAAYIVGLSFLARTESTGAVAGRWPILLLVAPTAANIALNSHPSFTEWTANGCFVVWVGWCISRRLGGVGRMVGGLLAGIILVDWSALANPSLAVSTAFVGFLLLALVLQRKVLAT